MKWAILSNGNQGDGMAAAGRKTAFALATVLTLGLSGCAAPSACYCRGGGGNAGPNAAYTLACPDVVEISTGPEHDVTGRLTVEPDGTIPLGTDGRLRVEGLTPGELAGQLADLLGVGRPEINVHVTEFASRQVFLCGPEAGKERSAPYYGPESVVDFIRRMGGLSQDAQPREVYVIRPNVAAGRRPQVFHVDLEAILVRNDQDSNVKLEPYDQVYVGETERAIVAKYLPQWMRFSRQPAADGKQ
jgi:protein involved in polysaccharide export with SLBB domain